MELAKCDLREISQKGADTLSLHILPCALFLLLPGMQHDAEGGMIVNSQAPLSMGFSRQEDWSGLPCPPPGDLPNPGTETMSHMSAALAGGFLTTGATWEAPVVSRPLHMSQEMSVWPGIEIFHHQGISDVPGQRPKVLSPSHCHLNSAEQSPDHLLLKVVQQRPRRWRPTSSSQTSIKDAHSSLE